MGSLSAATAQFCFDISEEMNCDHMTENLIFSPLALLSALTVVLFGARGDSASQMEKVLHLNEITRNSNSSNSKCEQDTGIHSHIKAFLSEINKSSHSQVHMASGIFAEESHPFLLKYLDCIEQLYKLKPKNLDFKNNVEEARMQINSWIGNEMGGVIKDLLSPNSIISSDQLVLVNAIAFRGSWKKGFQKGQTKVMTFKLNEFQSKPVQMMRLQGHFKTGTIKEPHLQVLEIPNTEDLLSMIIVLPSEDVGLGQVTKELTYEKLKTWIGSANMKDTAVDLYLPQLRFDVCHEDLAFILAALGMNDVFDHSRANLSGITARGGLVVSKIVQQVMLEVTEDDSESAHTDQPSKVQNPTILKVDHPFHFFVLHKETKMILFYGRVFTP